MAKIDYAALKKGGFMRQKQKGYFSLRIQVVGGNLTSENIRAVADVADKYGKGYVHITSRQAVQIPFINFENIHFPSFIISAELFFASVNIRLTS